MTPFSLALLVVALFGLCIGSFLNVVIARLPEGKSLVHPRSACPHCGHPIAWYDNVPLVSYVLLRGRCRSCRAPISWRYPAVEALTAALFVLALLRFGVSVEFASAALLLAGLVVIAGIDLDHRIIPDSITLPGIPLGFLASLVSARVGWLDSLIGILVGGGVFFVIILVSRGGMGGGDMKMGAMLGAFLGWKLGLLALLLGVFTGGAVAVGLLLLGRRGRKDAVPFGPFLALGGTLSVLSGEELLAWYLSRFAA